MNLDIVLDWMKTYQGKVTPCGIQRNFSISWWAANRIYDMLVRGGHVDDENRKAQLLLESQREAAPKMYGALEKARNAIQKNLARYAVKDEQALLEAFYEIESAMKEVRGEK